MCVWASVRACARVCYIKTMIFLGWINKYTDYLILVIKKILSVELISNFDLPNIKFNLMGALKTTSFQNTEKRLPWNSQYWIRKRAFSSQKGSDKHIHTKGPGDKERTVPSFVFPSYPYPNWTLPKLYCWTFILEILCFSYAYKTHLLSCDILDESIGKQLVQ